MESHGAPFAAAAQKVAGLLPDKLGQRLTERAGVDRLSALYASLDTVRRGGTVSIIGVYGGQTYPLPMMDIFDKGLSLRMGQAHVKRWIPDILPMLTGEGDPLGTEDLTTHQLPLEDAPRGYDMFQHKADGCIKVVLKPLGRGRHRRCQRGAEPRVQAMRQVPMRYRWNGHLLITVDPSMIRGHET